MWLQNKLKSEFRCLKTLLTTPPKSIMDKLYGIIGNLHCKLPGLKRQRSTVFFFNFMMQMFPYSLLTGRAPVRLNYDILTVRDIASNRYRYGMM